MVAPRNESMRVDNVASFGIQDGDLSWTSLVCIGITESVPRRSEVECLPLLKCSVSQQSHM
jgi:hypothetical protein